MGYDVRKALRYLLPLLLVLLMLSLFLTAVSRLDAGRRSEDRLRLEETLRQAAVAAYSLTGAYPESAGALAEISGLSWNEEYYDVKYEYCGANLMPDITVLIRGKQ